MLYSLAVYLYMLAVILVSPFHKKARLMVKGQWNTFRILRRQVDRGARYVWFHAASLGEFEQGRPLMERFRREHPEYKILLTFFSPSGYEVRKDYDGADIVCYLPFDTFGNVLRFFHLVKPEMVFLIKYEFWLNYIRYCRRKGIPVYSVSSIFRPNKVFFRWYGRGYARVLRKVTHFFVQDEESLRLLAKRGVKHKVTVVGDTRFDRVIDIQRQAKPLPLVERFKGGQRVIVAGSTWQPDEDLLIPYFNAHPEVKLILAPHLIHEDHLRKIEARLQRPALRYSRATADNVGEAQCLIIDCFGLLSSIYRYGEVAYVGGGFGAGIHNVPEAAVYGVPVLIGPKNRNFREALALLQAGGCLEVHDEAGFNATLSRLWADPQALQAAGEACRAYIHGNAGATELVFRHLFEKSEK